MFSGRPGQRHSHLCPDGSAFKHNSLQQLWGHWLPCPGDNSVSFAIILSAITSPFFYSWYHRLLPVCSHLSHKRTHTCTHTESYNESEQGLALFDCCFLPTVGYGWCLVPFPSFWACLWKLKSWPHNHQITSWLPPVSNSRDTHLEHPPLATLLVHCVLFCWLM